ncbi:MAG: hypothetical protein ACRDYE_02755 [Acidimicrobiales bacterium]
MESLLLEADQRDRRHRDVAYKPLGTDWLGYQSWPFHAGGTAWNRFMGHATRRQVTAPRCLDMRPWREAATDVTGGR